MEHSRVIFVSLVVSLFISTLVSWLTIVIYGFSQGYISEKTEEKYLRNLDKYTMINNQNFYIGLKGGDTLTFIATIAPFKFDPFHKWYINDVGMIKPNSLLSKKLDSIAANYIDPVNKYK